MQPPDDDDNTCSGEAKTVWGGPLPPRKAANGGI
jgi:hypothetical protein